jgi:hypothetical protein
VSNSGSLSPSGYAHRVLCALGLHFSWSIVCPLFPQLPYPRIQFISSILQNFHQSHCTCVQDLLMEEISLLGFLLTPLYPSRPEAFCITYDQSGLTPIGDPFREDTYSTARPQHLERCDTTVLRPPHFCHLIAVVDHATQNNSPLGSVRSRSCTTLSL